LDEKLLTAGSTWLLEVPLAILIAFVLDWAKRPWKWLIIVLVVFSPLVLGYVGVPIFGWYFDMSIIGFLLILAVFVETAAGWYWDHGEPSASDDLVPQIADVERGNNGVTSELGRKTDSVKRDLVFISYSHKDGDWLQRLQTMLKPSIRNNSLSTWDDTHIRAGARWRAEIRSALNRAKVAILLVSPDFLASDFIEKNELPPLLDSARKRGTRILWIPLRASLYRETEIGQYQAVHNPDKPLNSLKQAKLDQALVEICRQIKDAATET
jgi:hypothetical protein